MPLGNQILALRKKHSLSQEQLAEKVGVARQTISKWELGETAPDIKQAQKLSQIFNVSLDALLGNSVTDSVNALHNYKKNHTQRKKIIAISVAAVCLCLALVGIFYGIKRSQILHPQGVTETVAINRKGSIRIGKCNAKTIVFNESGKPAIICQLPIGFAPSEETHGLYTDKGGNYIKFNADYAESIVNPLMGTAYYSYYKRLGYESYMDTARAAMYYDLPKLGIFSSNEELYLAGGAQIIRQQLCAGQDADYYEISSDLSGSGDTMLIYGFALHFARTTWFITLKDYKDNYYFITIKDPNGVGKSIETVKEMLGSVYAGNALQYSNALDSSALQEAKGCLAEYLANSGTTDGYLVYQADDSRFVAYKDCSYVGIYHSMEDALKAMLNDPDLSKLSRTNIDNLWKYEQGSP